MIDAPGRPKPRFPADKEPIAAAEIAKVLNQINAGGGDLAICGGACGGDLLFAEASLVQQLRLELYIPFREEEFIAKSVDFADADWRSRFFAAKSRASLYITPDEVGPPQRTKILMNATMCTCSTLRCILAPTSLTSSAYGMERAVTAPAERSTSCKRSKAKAEKHIG